MERSTSYSQSEHFSVRYLNKTTTSSQLQQLISGKITATLSKQNLRANGKVHSYYKSLAQAPKGESAFNKFRIPVSQIKRQRLDDIAQRTKFKHVIRLAQEIIHNESN